MNSPLVTTTRRTWMQPLAFILCLLICACFAVVSSAQHSTTARDHAAPMGPYLPAQQISEYVREVFQDRDGDFWFGTNGDGVCRYDGKSLTYLSVEEGLGGRAVRGILQDEYGAMWFATNGGVSRYESGIFTNYTVANGLSDNNVWSMMLDKSGTIWVGTHGGVCSFDGKSFVPFPLPRAGVENPTSRFTPKVVFGMFEDQAGNLWFGTDGEGAHKYNGKSFTTYTTKDGLAGNQVRCIHGDRHGRIWIGTNGGGVSCYDGTAFRNFTKKDGLNNDRIYEILEDKAGNMWFSTLGAGACRYDGKSFTAFREDYSLMINDYPARGHVQEFFEDKDGILWLGCSGGLFRFDGKSFINVTRNGPWPVSAQKPAPASVAYPMAPFERMASGEWRVTFLNGSSMYDRWNWGPGRHSMQVQTDGYAAAGEPWRALRAFYWHPGRKHVCMLGISPYARGVEEGTFEFKGETADAVYDLYQTGRHRSMGLHWTFDGPDKYHETMLESVGGRDLTLLNALDYVRSNPRAVKRPRSTEEPSKPSERLRIFESLLGQSLQAKRDLVSDGATGDAFRIRSTFEFVPYADAIYARTVALTGDGEPMHLFDADIYHHTGTGALRCLALSNGGGVYEGDFTVLEGDALRLDLKGYEGDQIVSLVMRFDFKEDGTLRHRVWAVHGIERTLMFDIQHRRESRK